MKADSISMLVRRVAVIAILLLVAVLAFRIGVNFSTNSKTEEMVKIHIDTLIIRDTVNIEKPVYITKVVLDSILVSVPVVDTLLQTDTIYITLPVEQKYYKDDNYEAWVSGYRPELDSLNIFNSSTQINTMYEIQRKKSSRLSIGLQIGYGIYTYNNIIETGPYLGVGISYRLL